MRIGKKYSGEIYIGESLKPFTGSYICSRDEIIEQKKITGVAINNNILMVTIDNYPISPKNIFILFNALENFAVNADMISQISISLLIEKENVENYVENIAKTYSF